MKSSEMGTGGVKFNERSNYNRFQFSIDTQSEREAIECGLQIEQKDKMDCKLQIDFTEHVFCLRSSQDLNGMQNTMTLLGCNM